LAACVSRGDISDPISRKVTWFSFLNGDDIRAQCAPGAPERIRLVHNADYMERVRVYEVIVPTPGPMAPPSGSWVLQTRVLGPTPARLIVDPADLGVTLAPLGGVVVTRVIGPSDASRVRDALWADGFDGTPPAVDRLQSHRFWWLAVGCVDGAARFQAWAEDSSPAAYAALRFPAILQALDGTGIPLRRPTDVPDGGNPAIYDRDRASREVRFTLSVGPQGIDQGIGPRLALP